MRRHRGMSLVELLVSAAVGSITVMAVTAAFIGYNQAVWTQAGIRGAQASMRQSHQQVLRQLRMAGYGLEPFLAFDFPTGWRDDATRNRSDRLVFRMRNPTFGVRASNITATAISLATPLPDTLRRGQILQVVCPGALGWSYAQLAADAAEGGTALTLESATGAFPRLNDFTLPCFAGAAGLPALVFKVDVYDYSIQAVDDDGVAATPARPYLFRRHGLAEEGGNPWGEPVAEDVEALRVTFLRGDGTPFIPNPAAAAPQYDTPADDPRRFNDNPANVRAVRVGVVTRATVADPAARANNTLRVIPAFGGRPELPGPSGFRRIFFESTVQVRNLRSSEMFIPAYSTDSLPESCRGVAPADGLTCAGG